MSNAGNTNALEGGGQQMSAEFIKLKVSNQEGIEMHFRVKLDTRMGVLKKAYTQRMGVMLGSLRFVIDGRRIEDHHTPKCLEMEDDDTIEVYQEMTGGSSK